MAKSKFFRVAVEGGTSDGRVIERAWIEQMAANYNPATYGARVNCEHIRGFSPDKPFNAYGDVVALKAEEVTLNLNGKDEKRLALFAQIEPNAQLLAANKAGQKVYSSIEVDPNFANAGKAYLVGLAVTDSPASLGTEMLSFAATNPAIKAFLDAKKLRPENLFTAGLETTFELEADTTADANLFTPAGQHSIVKFITDLLSGKSAEPTPAAGVAQVIAAPAQAVSSPPGGLGGDQFTAAVTLALSTMAQGVDTVAAGGRSTQAAVDKLAGEFATLKQDLAKQPNGAVQRHASTGAGTEELADC